MNSKIKTMATKVKLVILVTVLCLVTLSEAMPVFFGKFLTGTRTPNDSFRHERGRRKDSGRTYNEIAKVINPNPYVNIGGGTLPGQPFWTFT